MAYKEGIFKDNVPKLVGLLVILVVFIPIMLINGVYIGNTSEMIGKLAGQNEQVQLANFATYTGMTVIFPLLIRIKGLLKSKQILIGSLVVQLLLSLLCASTSNMHLIIAASFVLGMAKMIGMIEVFLPMMFITSPTGDRAKSYSIVYPMILIVSFIGMSVSTRMADLFEWQYMYYIVSAFLLLAIVLVWLTYHNERNFRKIPFYQIDWLSFVLFSVMLMDLNYIFIYGNVEDWLNSWRIQLALVFLPLLLIWFVKRQVTTKRPFLSFKVLKYKNVRMSLLIMLVMQFIYQTSNIQTAFTRTFLKLSAVDTMNLNLWSIAGVFIGGWFCLKWYKNKGSHKGIILMGFIGLLMYHVQMYFLFAPETTREALILPVVFKGWSLLMMYIGLGLLVAENLNMMEMINSSLLLLLFRNIVSPVIATGVYTYLLNHLMIQNLSDISGGISIYAPDVAQTYQRSIRGLMYQGKSFNEAQSLLTMSVSGKAQLNALLVTAKQIFGFVIQLCMLSIVSIALLPIGENTGGSKWTKFKNRFKKKQVEEMVYLAD